MFLNGDIGCCGIMEMANIQDEPSTKAILRRFGSEHVPSWGDKAGRFPEKFEAAYFIFSQAGKENPYGEELAKLIKKLKLGRVYSTGWKTNPNSGNPVKVWIWTPSYKAFKKWYQENKNGQETD
jgi:hypothetical protein